MAPLTKGGRNAIAALREKEGRGRGGLQPARRRQPGPRERTRDLVKELWPEVYLCTSYDVLAEFREFERFATATVNASLMPIMDRYLERFERGVADLGIRQHAACHAVERRRRDARCGAQAAG